MQCEHTHSQYIVLPCASASSVDWAFGFAPMCFFSGTFCWKTPIFGFATKLLRLSLCPLLFVLWKQRLFPLVALNCTQLVTCVLLRMEHTASGISLPYRWRAFAVHENKGSVRALPAQYEAVKIVQYLNETRALILFWSLDTPPPHLLHRAPSSAVAQCYTVHKAHFSCLIAFFLSCHLCPYGWRIITGKLCVYCHTRLIYLCLIVLFSSRHLCPVVGGWHRKWNGPIIVWQMECIIHYIIHCVLYYINTELPESLWKYRTV